MAGFLPWNRVSHRLQNAENYWLCTVRPDGRPHAMPVWGAWHDDTVCFGTGLESVKAANLAASANGLVHLESGDDVVIVEGSVKRVLDPGIAEPIFARLSEKYGATLEDLGFADDLDAEAGGALFRLVPTLVLAWLEGAFAETESRWRFTPRRDE